MTMSANRRRVANRRGMFGMSSGQRGGARNVTDWVVGGRIVDSTGSPIATRPSWGPAGAFTLPAGGSGSYQGVVIIPTPSSGTPGVGRLRIDEVHGRVCVSAQGAGSSGIAHVAVGMYVSDVNNTTTLWNVRAVTTAADCARDDYLYLEGKSFTCGATDSVPDQPNICFDLKLPFPVVIGGGQALHVTISNDAASTLTCIVTAYFRSRVGPVA